MEGDVDRARAEYDGKQRPINAKGVIGWPWPPAPTCARAGSRTPLSPLSFCSSLPSPPRTCSSALVTSVDHIGSLWGQSPPRRSQMTGIGRLNFRGALKNKTGKIPRVHTPDVRRRTRSQFNIDAVKRGVQENRVQAPPPILRCGRRWGLLLPICSRGKTATDCWQHLRLLRDTLFDTVGEEERSQLKILSESSSSYSAAHLLCLQHTPLLPTFVPSISQPSCQSHVFPCPVGIDQGDAVYDSAESHVCLREEFAGFDQDGPLIRTFAPGYSGKLCWIWNDLAMVMTGMSVCITA